MRKGPTGAEELLWEHLRHRQLHGFRFRRQHSLERFVVDFYCSEARLAVEIDGPVHQYRQEDDVVRQAYLESRGLCVMRFCNDEVLRSLDRVLQQIAAALGSPSPQAEGPGGEVGRHL